MDISLEKFEEVCKLIEESSLGVKHLCKQAGVYHRHFRNAISDSLECAERYARAKSIQADMIADEILDIADDGTNDFMTVVKGDQEYEAERKEVVNRSRLRVDSRKWLLSKLLPKKYGEKIEVDNNHNFPAGINIQFTNGPKDEQ
jgi:hypothetical protein